MKPRTLLLNFLIEKFKFQSYLEIGVNNPKVNFDRIQSSFKVGVDPDPKRKDIIALTSDEYFKTLKLSDKFDLIFIDGLHHADFVLRDIENSLKHLSRNGVIVCHDLMPESVEEEMVPRIANGSWTGDCWKAWAYLRMNREDLHMVLLDIDHGLGIIRSGQQVLFPFKQEMQDLKFDFFQQHKDELMNVIELDSKIYELGDLFKHFRIEWRKLQGLSSNLNIIE